VPARRLIVNDGNLHANGRDDCPPAVVLDHFVAAALSAEESERIEQHVLGCSMCSASLARDDGDGELTRLLRTPTEAPLLSLQEADHILENIKRLSKASAANRRAGRRFRFTERELGKGGMGVVHEGVDTELGRAIAVKRLKDEWAADLRNIKQFEHEARVTALLEHPGIVPVYGLGQDPSGRPFYAMRMVKGERLTAAVNGLHQARRTNANGHDSTSELRRLLARFVTVCNTVAYAHTRGFVHLDIKPSNILLGPFGETFTMDWGLAMKADRPVPRPSGTVPYMSPEQVERRFDQIGPASDVYALGGTLFTIVSGRKPLRDAATVGPGDSTGIPKPLYAICRKAMEREPEKRYGSPLALADDVERWLANEPTSVLAYTWTERLARWQRRHRSATMAAMLVLVTITVAAILTTVVVDRARESEHKAFASVDAHAKLAIEAVEKFREAVRDNLDVLNRPDLAALRKKLLAEPLKFFQQLRDELQGSRDPSPAMTLKLGRANLNLAFLLNEIDSKPNAILAYEQGVATLAPLADSLLAPGDREIQQARFNIAEGLGGLGLLQRDIGKVVEARQRLRKALGYCSRLTPDDSDSQIPILHARLLDTLAKIEAPEAPDLAVSLMEQAIALLRPLADDGLVVPLDPDLLARISMNLGSGLKTLQRFPEAAERFHEAISALESLVRASPGHPTYRANLATALYNFANLQMRNRDGSDFWPNYERSRDLLEGLVREFPSATNYSALLVNTCGNMGVLRMQSERPEEARALLDRVREIGEGLVRDNPTVLKYRSDLGKTYVNLSDLESRAGRPGKAVDLLRPACDSLRQVFRARTGDTTAREALATASIGLASGLVDLGRYTEALPAYRECVELELELVRNKDPLFPPSDWLLQSGLLGLARCYRHLGRVSEAAEPLSLLSDSKPLKPVAIARELTLCSLDTKDGLAAERYADRAIDFLRKAVATRAPDVESLRADSAFKPLLSRPDFQDLLADAAFPADPFAR
jgi:tetratricopeptide (TPR) repeat protein